MVARKLNRMIVEHPTLLQHNNHTSNTGGLSGSGRPLLVLLDRNSDLITPIQHCSTYQALIDDVLIHKANRVEFEVSTDPSSTTDKSTSTKRNAKTIVKKYDLDPDTDPFYSVQKFVPFPEAIEQNDSELKDVTHREQMIRSKTTTTTETAATTKHADPFGTTNTGAADLANAVDSLPILIERKKQLEVHTSILQGVMNEVAARDVPQFYDIESSLATGSYKNDAPKAKKDVLVLISDPLKGNVHDKLRLVIVYALATNAKSTDLEEVATAFQQVMEVKAAEDKTIGPIVSSGMKAISYIKQLRLMHIIPSANDMIQELQANKSKPNESSSTALLSSFMAKATTQATGFLAKATDRVSSMLGKIHKHHATVVTENLCDYMRPNNVEDDTYLYLDPKVKGDITKQQLNTIASRPPIHHAIVFMIGGGCYNEYQNMQSLLSNDRRAICYGSTELLDPNSFVQQLGQLG
jgi:sec1 family domain-containing protein 1